LQQVWAGVDIGKAHHHAVVIDSEGRRLLSRRVANDQAVLAELIAEISALAGEVTWAIDVRTGGAALLVTLLLTAGQKVFYLSGHMVNRACDGYHGEGKTDARDAAVIADQPRMRRDLRPVLAEDELITESQVTRRTMTQPPRSNCMLMPALPRTVGQTRSCARWLLGTWQLESMGDTVELLVNELATNTINATGITEEEPDDSRLIGNVKPIYICLSVHSASTGWEFSHINQPPHLAANRLMRR
jgi:hypothetical protein